MKRPEVREAAYPNELGQWPILRVARAIILSPDKKDFLLVYRAGSHFRGQGENAGGKIEEGEESGETRKHLIRELREELQLEPEDYCIEEQEPFLDFMMFDPQHPHTPHTRYANKLVLTYTFQVVLSPDAQVVLSPEEHTSLKWCRVQTFDEELNITPYTLSTLQAYRRNNGRVTFSCLSQREGKMINIPTYPSFSHANGNHGANR